ncbi:MAG TPA: transglutaminase family protein [Beijerinckiaceae bacterium]|jgi:transglutaminase-like putative cysteine protease
MRLHVRHEIEQVFTPAAKGLNQILRLTPRSHEGQHVIAWRLDVDANCRVRQGEDAYGNIQHAFTLQGPVESLRIVAEGEVETFDTVGVLRDTAERFPPELFLRETRLTAADDGLRAFAAELPRAEPLATLHALLRAVHETAERDDEAPEDAAAALARRTGAVGGLAHVFVACARLLGAPARVARGCHVDSAAQVITPHVWAEAHVEGVGWIGFDPALGHCPAESHLRVACGLDALDAAALRGASVNHAAVRVTHVVDRGRRARGQSQRQ